MSAISLAVMRVAFGLLAACLAAGAAIVHAAAVVPEQRKAALGRCVPGGDRCALQGASAVCGGGRTCELDAVDTFTAQVAIEIDDQACQADMPGAVVRLTVYGERPRNGGAFATPTRTFDYCGTDVTCKTPTDPFLCAFDDVVTLSEDTTIGTRWLTLSKFPTSTETALRGVLGQGTPIIWSATLVGEDRHANDAAPTVLRYCIKGYLLRP